MRDYSFSILIHILLIIGALGIKFQFQIEKPSLLEVAVGRPPSGLPAIPNPAGIGTRIDAVPIPSRKKIMIKRAVGHGPSLSLPGQRFDWGKKQFVSSFGDIDIPGGKGVGRPWYIEGKASGRKVIKEVIPEYPQGYKKEATIKLAFQVAPDGSVKKIVVVKKGDPLLEKVAFDAFSKWRFESIMDTVDQGGEITFLFRLK